MTGEYHALSEKNPDKCVHLVFSRNSGARRFRKRTACERHSQARQSLNLLGLTAGKGKDGRGDKIRTCDPLNPIQVRYRAAPRPDSPVL